MLTKLMALTRAELKSKLASIDVSAVKGRSLKRKFEAIRNRKQGGFTLLELLVVVAILAAIAGTATIMLQDTDRKGAAAAHVAMMDELSKGIQTFRVLNGGLYPDKWDSLLYSSDGSWTGVDSTGIDNALLSIVSDDLKGNLALSTINSTELDTLAASGIWNVRIINGSINTKTVGFSKDVEDYCDNANIGELVRDKGNDVVPANIYRSPDANGCGADLKLQKDAPVVLWNGGYERVGVPSGLVNTAGATQKIVAFGIGPDATLFDPAKIGALSNVPVYRHVTSDEYNRFVVLFNLYPYDAKLDTDTGNYEYRLIKGQATFQAIIDGAGDTKDEELGEVDNVRPT
jgi:prepilin-type N-terminal cleavage/methylation domain-containing protein